MPNKIMKPLARRGDREVPMEYVKKKKKPVLAAQRLNSTDHEVGKGYDYIWKH
jgi:hypothetical protein